MIKKIFSILFVILFLNSLQGKESVILIKDGPIHEAFLAPETNVIVMQAVAKSPPENLQERAPKRPSDEMRWYRGYWAWDEPLGEYIWVSGVWRKPPSGHSWVAGYWKEFHEGWVWFPGFWISKGIKELKFIQNPPKEAIAERGRKAPGAGFFWVSGHWEQQSGKKQEEPKYKWLEGRWVAFDSEVVYMPARTFWRPEGYLVLDGYWDWKIEDRGVAYANMRILERSDSAYEPRVELTSSFIMQSLFPRWPNYLILFHSFFYHHPHLWNEWGVFVPWWQWPSWWSLNSREQWALWWWWTHPGSSAPDWMDMKQANDFLPPSDFILKIMKGQKPPITYTREGFISERALAQSIERLLGHRMPILPADPGLRQEILERVAPKSTNRFFMKPRSKSQPINAPERPPIQEPLMEQNHTLAPTRVQLPPLPERRAS